MKTFMIKFLATWFFSGFLKPAPGTWGSIAGALTFYILLFVFKLSLPVLTLLSVFVFLIGIPISAAFEKLYNKKDASSIVIDEVAALWLGYCALLALFGPSTLLPILYLILFRIFDITKPYPIKKMEKHFKDGFSVMIDDIMAGVYALIAYIPIAYLLSL